MRRRVYAQRPEGRRQRMFALRHWVTSGLLAQAMADRQVKEIRRAMRQKNAWLRKDWRHDEERVAAAVAKRVRRAS